MIASHFLTIYFLRSIAPAFGKLAAIQTQMEGEYRGAHTRLITNSGEIAFYHGGKIEEGILNRAQKSQQFVTNKRVLLAMGDESFKVKFDEEVNVVSKSSGFNKTVINSKSFYQFAGANHLIN
jgi:ABC-type uncharacterized transport system fused permease/ATPase subunit